ncbi:MAG: hypothetical protein MHM6MM_004332 [Cercozoa sp. M6MM]
MVRYYIEGDRNRLRLRVWIRVIGEQAEKHEPACAEVTGLTTENADTLETEHALTSAKTLRLRERTMAELSSRSGFDRTEIVWQQKHFTARELLSFSHCDFKPDTEREKRLFSRVREMLAVSIPSERDSKRDEVLRNPEARFAAARDFLAPHASLVGTLVDDDFREAGQKAQHLKLMETMAGAVARDSKRRLILPKNITRTSVTLQKAEREQSRMEIRLATDFAQHLQSVSTLHKCEQIGSETTIATTSVDGNFLDVSPKLTGTPFRAKPDGSHHAPLIVRTESGGLVEYFLELVQDDPVSLSERPHTTDTEKRSALMQRKLRRLEDLRRNATVRPMKIATPIHVKSRLYGFGDLGQAVGFDDAANRGAGLVVSVFAHYSKRHVELAHPTPLQFALQDPQRQIDISETMRDDQDTVAVSAIVHGRKETVNTTLPPSRQHKQQIESFSVQHNCTNTLLRDAALKKAPKRASRTQHVYDIGLPLQVVFDTLIEPREVENAEDKADKVTALVFEICSVDEFCIVRLEGYGVLRLPLPKDGCVLLDREEKALPSKHQVQCFRPLGNARSEASRRFFGGGRYLKDFRFLLGDDSYQFDNRFGEKLKCVGQLNVNMNFALVNADFRADRYRLPAQAPLSTRTLDAAHELRELRRQRILAAVGFSSPLK